MQVFQMLMLYNITNISVNKNLTAIKQLHPTPPKFPMKYDTPNKQFKY